MKKVFKSLAVVTALSTYVVAGGIAGSVNGVNITVKEANEALKVLTKEDTNWSKLPATDRKQLIRMMAPAKLVALKSKSELSKEEKDAAIAGFWMNKSISQTKVTDAEAQEVYDRAKSANSKQQIPPFDAVKNNIKLQIAQDKVVSDLMNSAKIEVK